MELKFFPLGGLAKPLLLRAINQKYNYSDTQWFLITIFNIVGIVTLRSSPFPKY